MKNIKIYTFTLAVWVCALAGCESLLDTEPEQSLSSSAALGDYNGVVAVMASIYNTLQGQRVYGLNEMVMPDVLADNMRISVANRGIMVDEQINNVRANLDSWSIYYPMINTLNNVLAALDNIDDGTEQQKDQQRGEAYFLRALAYHNLVRNYAREPGRFLDLDGQRFDLGVPIMITAVDNIGDITLPARATVEENYQQIEADLLTASGLLNNTTGLPHFGNKLAAQALLARVYLYWQKWGAAAAMADSVIANAGIPLAQDYQTVFSDGAESLFELLFQPNENVSPAAFLTLDQNGNGTGDGILRQDFLDNIEADDKRFVFGEGEDTDMVRPFVKSGERVVYTLKYNGYTGTPFVDNIVVLRISEMYLTRAEANLENNSAIGATPQADLDALRARAGLRSVPATLANIMKERRYELVAEGHRFFDLKRRGMAIPKGTPGVDCAVCTIPYEDFRLVNELPRRELRINTNLVDNPGY